MKKKKVYEMDCIPFHVRFSNPKSYKKSKTPVRALITPLDAHGKKITKRQLFGIDSDYPVEKPVRGKSKQDIIKNIFPNAAQELITAMREKHLLPDSEAAPSAHASPDLAAIGQEFQDTFFLRHANRDNWSEGTVRDYKRKYQKVLQALTGIFPEQLTDDMYQCVQECLARNSFPPEEQEKAKSWKYGDSVSSTGQKQLHLLHLLIADLQSASEYHIPARAFAYKGNPSQQEQLLAKLSEARSFLPQEMLQLSQMAGLPTQAKLLFDCGERISENGGLLWHSFHAIDSSQGSLYYIDITGQLENNCKRKEYTKTEAGYRSIPVSQELGKALMSEYLTCKGIQEDADLRLMCVLPESQTAESQKKDIINYMESLTKAIPAFLRSPEILQSQRARRVYQFDEEAQDQGLNDALTNHALRRNFNTWEHCSSGMGTLEISIQMGHAPEKGMMKSKRSRKTPDELRKMCLQKYVSGTDVYPAHSLCYHTDGPYTEMEVAACMLELTLASGTSADLTIEDTEPGNLIRLLNSPLDVTLLHQEERRGVDYDFALLAARSKQEIRKIRRPFAVALGQDVKK